MFVKATCIRVIKKNNRAKWYRLQDDEGNTRDFEPDILKREISRGAMHITNLKLTSDNRLIYSELPRIQHIGDKYVALRSFEAKQALMQTTIFDFDINRLNGDIYIVNYYDSRDRKEVIIPNFVDHFEASDTSSVFLNCKYIEKVIAHSNIKGSIAQLFEDCTSPKLDLSEFDTSNITDMHCMFMGCNTQILNFGKNFNTYKVIEMYKMFMACQTQTINLGDKFDTSNVAEMSCMFYKCMARSINLGDRFDMSKVSNTVGMFNLCAAQKIVIGKHVSDSTIQKLKSLTNIPIVIEE